MAKQKIALISERNVGVHRIVGRDRDGVNVEEKVCPIPRNEVVLDLDGNEVTISLDNGRIPSPEGARYGHNKREDGIRSAGWLPRAECPFTTRYHHLVRGPLVQPGDDEEACDGAPGGCPHYQAVRASRQAKAKQAAKERNAMPGDEGAAAIVSLGESIKAWTEAQMAQAPGLAESRQRLRAGQGEGGKPAR
jgi:hypothetical protein